MKRHAAGGPPPIPSPATLLIANPAFQFRHDAQLPMTLGVEGSVAKSNKTLKIMGGYDGQGNVKSTGFQAKAMMPGVVVLLGARYDDAGDYNDANGDKVNFGYKRDTEQVVVNWMPKAGTSLKLVGVRDVIKDDLQPHHGMDVDYTERLVGKAIFNQKLEGDIAKGFGLQFVSKTISRTPDNYKNRTPGPAKMRADTDRQIFDGKAHLNMALAGWASKLTVNGGWDNHDARRYNDTQNSINAIKLPDITRTSFGLGLDGKRGFGSGVTVEAGARYDYMHADPAAANKTGTAFGGGAPLWNASPAALYQTYYGTTGNLESTEHNLSTRLRVTKAMMEKRFAIFGDLSRKVRSPDNIERYHAVTHPQAQNRWIGNPDLNPEAHHKAEIGFTWKGAHYKGYGKLAPVADSIFDADNMEFKLTGYVDKVQDFVAMDRAADQAVIHRNVDATFAGVNFDARWNMTQNWSVAANAAYLWGENDTDKRALYQIAPLEGNLAIDYRDMLGTIGTWNVGAKLRMVAKQTRTDGVDGVGLDMDRAKSTDFATLDLYAGAQIGNRFSLKGGVKNVFNADYQEHLTGSHIAAPTRSGINAPGRTFFLRSQMAF
jgi:iron complex outermembrane receptor protein